MEKLWVKFEKQEIVSWQKRASFLKSHNAHNIASSRDFSELGFASVLQTTIPYRTLYFNLLWTTFLELYSQFLTMNKFSKSDTTSSKCSQKSKKSKINKTTSSTLMTICSKKHSTRTLFSISSKPSKKSASTTCLSQPPWNLLPLASPKIYKTRFNSINNHKLTAPSSRNH